MRSLTLLPALWVGVAVASVEFPLEWNSTYSTEVPYELELDPAKLGLTSFTVSADGKQLPTTVLSGRKEETRVLRFTVPKGISRLTCRADAGEMEVSSSSVLDNLFSGALADESVSRWQMAKGIVVKRETGGLRFSAETSAEPQSYVSYDVSVPVGLAGQPVKFEADVVNRSSLVWGGVLMVQQLDAEGAVLPEALTDVRWTSHMRPPNRPVKYREQGRIHPQARSLRLRMELRRVKSRFDDYGGALTNAAETLPSLLLSHVAVRPAAVLPFPKYDDSFFGRGASDAVDDSSLKLGGDNQKAFWYQTRTRAGWSQRYQFRNERDLAFPAGAATVEAWFRPDWAELKARQAQKDMDVRAVTLFDAWQGFRDAEGIKADQTMFRLNYDPARHFFSLQLRDWKGRNFVSDWKNTKIDFPDGTWTHLAVQWRPGETAELFMNGKKVGTLPIPEWQATPIDDNSIKLVNDLWAMEFFFGSCGESARLWRRPNKYQPFFEGEGDALRISFGCRYADGFVPERRPAFDGETCALFGFDRSFDGRCGGYGFVPGCMRALTDRVDHRVTCTDGRVIQYYPQELLPEHDPFKALTALNYPVVSSASDHRASWRPCTKSFDVKAGDRIRIDCPQNAVADFIEISNKDGMTPIRYPILVNRGRLDPRSFGDLRDSLRELGGLSDRERVNTVFQYAISASDYFMNHQLFFAPGADIPHPAYHEAMLLLNAYCGFECGPLNDMTANLLTIVAGCPATKTTGYAHSFQEVFFDGRNHIYDLSWQRFIPDMNNESSAGLAEAGDQPGAFNRIGMSVDHFIRKGTRGYVVQDPAYREKFGMILNPGETFRVWTSNDGQMNNLHTQSRGGRWGRKSLWKDTFDYAEISGAKDPHKWVYRVDRAFPHYSTSCLRFEGRPSDGNPAFKVLDPESFAYRVRSCYPIVWAEYAAFRADGTPASLDVSTDDGRTWRPLPAGPSGVASVEYMVKGRHEYQIRVRESIGKVTLFVGRTEGEVNPRTYPGFLKPGANDLAFKANSDGQAQVTLGWREKAKEIAFAGALSSGTIPGFERALVLLDPAKTNLISVMGASTSASLRTYGRIRAELKRGALSLSYDPTKPAAFRHGDDLLNPTREFPAFAAVDVVDGDAVKTLTVVVSPDSRLLTAHSAENLKDASLKPADVEAVQDRVLFAKNGARASLPFDRLPGGRYLVLALARFPAHSKSVRISLLDAAGKKHVIARDENSMVDYLDACYGQKGGRSRWKWDCAGYWEEWGQTAKAWSLRRFDFPAGMDRLDLCATMNDSDDAELAGVLILPEPDNEALFEITKVLMGLNCDPFHVR